MTQIFRIRSEFLELRLKITQNLSPNLLCKPIWFERNFGFIFQEVKIDEGRMCLYKIGGLINCVYKYIFSSFEKGLRWSFSGTFLCLHEHWIDLDLLEVSVNKSNKEMDFLYEKNTKLFIRIESEMGRVGFSPGINVSHVLWFLMTTDFSYKKKVSFLFLLLLFFFFA